jgi:hypothetical protein
MSDNLGMDYIRLLPTEKFYVSGCEPKDTQKRKFKNGFIIQQNEF